MQEEHSCFHPRIRALPLLSTACLTCIFCKTAIGGIVSHIEIPYISIVLRASCIRNHDTHFPLNPVRGKTLFLKDKTVYFSFVTGRPSRFPSSLSFQAKAVSSSPDDMLLAVGLYFQLVNMVVCVCVCCFTFILNILKLLGMV